MARLLVLVEGGTEVEFVNVLLAAHLSPIGFEAVRARRMGKAHSRSHRGGVRGWPEVRKEILQHLHADRSGLLGLMVDYYGVPGRLASARSWPGHGEAARLPFSQRARTVIDAMLVELSQRGGDTSRFFPFVVMHEFESLLFSECSKFAQAIREPSLQAAFQSIRDRFGSPEEINDSASGHPSKRIERIAPRYRKLIDGNLAALAIGLDTIRAECPHFREWLERLEQVAQAEA